MNPKLNLQQCYQFMKKPLLSFILSASLIGCAAKILKKDHADDLLKNSDFEQSVQVTSAPVEYSVGHYVRITPKEYDELYANYLKKNKKIKLVKRKYQKPKDLVVDIKNSSSQQDSEVQKNADAKDMSVNKNTPRHLPEFEDQESFLKRRPVVDPYRVGEKLTYEMSYFGVRAGDLQLEVAPFVYVNGRKSYHFIARGQTAAVFEVFYAVDDWLETFVDFEDMIPYSYALHVKESKQLRETRCFFDWKKKLAHFWDKRITKEDGVEEKKLDWNIQDFSQNVFSAPFYLRSFKLEPGKKIQYRMAHEKDNIMLTGEVLRREKIETPMGEIDTVVLKPQIDVGGVFKPIGDIFIWLTDDDRRFIVRIESKIKIGKIVAQLKSIDKGMDNPPVPTPIKLEEHPE